MKKKGVLVKTRKRLRDRLPRTCCGVFPLDSNHDIEKGSSLCSAVQKLIFGNTKKRVDSVAFGVWTQPASRAERDPSIQKPDDRLHCLVHHDETHDAERRTIATKRK